ncbi:hypothetical protein [Sediminibacterium sp.]|uniref:hypothetical protein n=1 Tax=Sediminibacterium sp. TaxID=1917865 RepID=UPI003F724EFD
MKDYLSDAIRKVEKIKKRSLTIYDKIEIGDHELWLTSQELSAILNEKLVGNTSLQGLPLRTRSKVAKQITCIALGYPIPNSFKKVQPRFFGLSFDTYVQKSNNLQVWNEELDVERRYVLIRIDESEIISKIKVVTGSNLAVLDTTGTLTQKYQARLINGIEQTELISLSDTDHFPNSFEMHDGEIDLSLDSPIDEPSENKLLPIKGIFESIQNLIGESFLDSGHDQERNRGAALHALVCKALGYKKYFDDGQFPDIKHQLLEIKLQTSPTIDLGLVSPDSDSFLDIEKIGDKNMRHCDVRYALFFAVISQGIVTINNIYLTTGKDFFTRFPKFGGKVLNKKIQIPLPRNFFNT